jgi:hypothetical protein
MMTEDKLSPREIEYRDALITHTKYKIVRYLDDRKVPFKARLLMYLLTPRLCFNSSGMIPTFSTFVVKHGDIDWKRDFPWLLRDQTVNLVKICKHVIQGNLTYFPEGWDHEMIFDFVKYCVDNGIHEFDYCGY